MFDTIMGLPVHILVIHAVVVLGPIAALLALAYAIRPAWRNGLRLPLVLGAVATGLSGFVAGESGEQLEHRLQATGGNDAAAMALLHEHTEAGDLTKVLCLLFMVVVLGVVYFLLPATKPARSKALGLLGAAAMVVISCAAIVSIAITGHTGAKSAWADQVVATQGATTTGGGD